MKNINKIFTLLLTLGLLNLTSCQKFLDINVDPTLKQDASFQELLPIAQFYTSEASYSQAYVACQYAQQIGSASANNGTDANYEAENAGGWSNLYIYVLPQLNNIIKKGKTSDAPAYVGIAKVLLAYNLGMATSSWENIPFTKADYLEIDSFDTFTPTYDSQKSVYGSIQTLLDEAIVELAKTSGSKPGNDDMIYMGDTSKWTRLAYSLKAKYAMHLSVPNGTAAATAALASVAKGMASNADDFQLQYNSKNLSPWYSRVALANTTSNVSVTFSSTLIDLMNGKTVATVDPRLPIIAGLKKGQTTYAGASPGTGSGATVDLTTTNWYSNIKAPIVMMTYAETKAIEAEARFLANGGSLTSAGTTEDAYNAYLEIAANNMKKLGVSADKSAAYLASADVAVGASKLSLLNIMREKYKAMVLQGDIWTDLRRYNYLDFPIPANLNPDLGGKRIQRMRYPSSELTRNATNAEANVKKPEVAMWVFSK